MAATGAIEVARDVHPTGFVPVVTRIAVVLADCLRAEVYGTGRESGSFEGRSDLAADVGFLRIAGFDRLGSADSGLYR